MEPGSPFQPKAGSTVQLATTSTSGAIQLGIGATADQRACKVANTTSVPGYVEFGSASNVAAVFPSTATIAGSCVVPGNTERVFVIFGCTWMAGTTSAGNTVLTATPGQGGI